MNEVVIIKDVILVIMAVFGLTAWYRQMVGVERYKLAKSNLIILYKIRNLIQIVRNPAGYSNEYLPEMLNSMGYLKEEFNYEGNKYKYGNRLKPLLDAQQELELLHIEARIEWGEDIKNLILPIRICINKLNNEIGIYLYSLENHHTNLTYDRKIIYNSDPIANKDIFSIEIENAVNVYDIFFKLQLKNIFFKMLFLFGYLSKKKAIKKANKLIKLNSN